MTDAIRLDAMIASCRTRSNMETSDQANAFITDAEITGLLNYFLRRVYTRLVRARSANYYRASTDVAISAGIEVYALAAQVLQIISASFISAGGEGYPLYAYTEAERHMYDLAGAWSRFQRVAYQLNGQNIRFIPTPTGTYTVRLNYVPAFTNLAAAGDTFDGVCGFEDAAIWETVAAMKDKDEADPSFARGQAQIMWDEIDALAFQRDNAAPPRVQRVRKQRRDGGGWVD